jgi:dipeptidase
MCDTLVATGEATADGSVILAKNSDRQPNEAHVLARVPRARHEPGEMVQCTYIAIPQVLETYEVLLSKPFWIWGAEMGANEHGVAIANEAVFTKEPYDKEPGLIGVDLLRLALERASTARQALDVIVALLAAHGQGGNCGFRHKEYYHNSFLLADPAEAWLLETAGRYWAAERVRDVRSISNGLTIGSEWDLASPDLVAHAVDKGWCTSRADFHFARCYSDFLYTRLDGSRPRQCRSSELLQAGQGQIDVLSMMDALRDHGARAEGNPDWDPSRGRVMDTLCVHASLGPLRPSQSTGAMVAHLSPGLQTYWLTGTSATCTGIFKPAFLGGATLPDLGPQPEGTYDPESLWWFHERLHRAVIRDYAGRQPLYREQRDVLEASFVHEVEDLRARLGGVATVERAEHLTVLTASCFERARQATARWIEAVQSVPPRNRATIPFRIAWAMLNRQAGFEG